MKIQLLIALYTLMCIEKGDCNCSLQLIKETKDDYITGSSFNTYGCYPRYIRLNSSDLTKTWCPAKASPLEYIQVEFQYSCAVTAFVFRGREHKYLKSFTIKTSQDGISWSNVTDHSGKKKIYLASEDFTTLAIRPVNEKILAKFIRVHPDTWYNFPAFQMEILGCPKAVSKCIDIGVGRVGLGKLVFLTKIFL